MTDTFEWQGRVGDSWAEEWRRTDRSFEALHAVLIDRAVAAASPESRVLDIGCGAGQTSIDLAARLPNAEVRGIDLSDALIAVARDRSSAASFAGCDATLWDGGDWKPGLLVSRHGVMFFDDPVGAFRHFASVAAPGAQMVFTCFRSPALNPWASKIAALLPEAPKGDPHAPGPFAFADRERVDAILADSGWKDIEAEAIDFRYVAGAGADPVADALAFFSRIGPAARAAAQLGDADRQAFLTDLEGLLRRNLADNAVSFDAAAWLWTAHI